MSGDIRVEQTALPGIGVRHEFVTRKGRRVAVVEHRSGRRDFLLYDRYDPDAASETVTLTAEEADVLAEFLGVLRITERLTQLTSHVSDLVTEEVPVPVGSAYDGRTLGDTQARSRTGASVVAVLRAGTAILSPTPAFGLLGGDELVVVGTTEGVAAVGALLTG